MIAVGIGYTFMVVDEDVTNGINLVNTGVQVKYNGSTYTVHKGETYADSRKIDVILDKYGEASISTYRI